VIGAPNEGANNLIESPGFIGFLSLIASRSQQISQQSALVHRTYRAATAILPHCEMFHNLARAAGKADGSREVEMRAPHTSYPKKKMKTARNCRLCYGCNDFRRDGVLRDDQIDL
jgi:hypothetical protein